MGNESQGWFLDIAQVVGVELSDVTLLAVGLFSFAWRGGYWAVARGTTAADSIWRGLR